MEVCHLQHVFNCDLGLKFYMLKFWLCKSSDPRITENQNEMFMEDFQSPHGPYTNSHLIDENATQTKWQMWFM